VNDELLYPVTIIQTRYGGSYENGTWAAFNCHENEVPPAASDDDLTAANYWWSDAAENVGRGESPNEALADLERRLND
jgi:hypothetical protein